MSLGEFSLIERYFSEPAPAGALGVGDDAARIALPPGTALVACKDLLIEGRHFFPDVAARSLGHKALAVNLSDLAAMGAQPMACMLGLGLPRVDEAWLAEFAQGLHALARQSGCPLLGGDTVRHDAGVIVSVTALGTLPVDHPGLRRAAALPGDDIWVSGFLGAPDIALALLKGELTQNPALLDRLRSSLEYPVPRLSLGRALLSLAHAAIDVSDGLAQDLGHILMASRCGAILEEQALPVHPALADIEPVRLRQAILNGGDLYELCFTAPAAKRDQIDALSVKLAVPLSRVGSITNSPGLWLKDRRGQRLAVSPKGYDHFAGHA